MSRFGDIGKLGFMRVIQIFNAFSILLNFIALVFVSGRDFRGALVLFLFICFAYNFDPYDIGLYRQE